MNQASEQILQQLAPHIEPAPVSIWPLAPLWWVIIVVSLITLASFILFSKKLIKMQLYRRTLIAQVNQISTSDLTPRQKLEQLNQLIKRICIQTYGRAKVAQLSGLAWAKFLDSTIHSNHFTKGAGQRICLSTYKPDLECNDTQFEQSNALAIIWIKRHR